MPINKQGIWTYSDNDVVQSWPIFMNLGFNSVSEVVKGLQDGRVIIAKNDADRNAKLKSMRDAAGKNPDVLIYQVDRKTMSSYSDGRLTTIFGAAVETGYTNNNDNFGTWKRYDANPSAIIQTSVVVPKPGLWLFSSHITIANDNDAANANIDVFVQLDNYGGFVNVGTVNTYNYNKNVMSFRAAPISKFTDRANQKVDYAVKVAVNPTSNIGWGGLTVQATKIG